MVMDINIINIEISDGFIRVIQDILSSMIGRFGGSRQQTRFANVEDFWYRGVSRGQVKNGNSVEVTGLLSTFAPYMPCHPRAKPGYTPAGWANVEEIIREHAEKSSTIYGSLGEYDIIDSLVWMDPVVRLPVLEDKRLYCGLYNEYGKSFESLPVVLTLDDKKQAAYVQSYGLNQRLAKLTTVKGKVRPMKDFIGHIDPIWRELGVKPPSSSPGYPCHYIEVESLKAKNSDAPVLYATSWGIDGNKVFMTEFFDFLHPTELRDGISRLTERTEPAGERYAWYDFLDKKYSNLEGNRRILAALGLTERMGA